jgi:hypothetical protein
MNRPRILFLAPNAPYPLTSGAAIRQFHLIRAYSAVADVELVCFLRSEKKLSEVRAGLAPLLQAAARIPASPGTSVYPIQALAGTAQHGRHPTACQHVRVE